MTPSAAGERVAAVARSWDADLDPALLAHLGPGGCDGLAGALDGRPLAGAGDLLAVAGDVAAHTAGCPACADRQRAMASVRRLVAGTPLPEPPLAVAVAASGSRLQPPVPPPPLQSRHRSFALRAVAAAAVAVALAGAGALVTAASDDDGRSASLLALTKVPAAAGSLELVPAEVAPLAGRVALGNRSGAPVAWEAAADASWLEVTPQQGRLEPGAEQWLVFRGSPPEGEVRAFVRVTGDDGSATMAAVAGTVEHPPDLGATADGCRVTAHVEDEGDVMLTLHWRVGSTDATAAMSPPADAESFGALPPGVAPLTWWVSAIDGRGNQARTPDVALATPC